MTFVMWCSGCNSEPAVTQIDIEWNGQWRPLDIGEKCLTRLKEEGRMEQ